METIRPYAIGTAATTKAKAYRRRGVGYVYFLGTMMLVTVIGLSALMYARIQLRTASGINDSAAARLYAQSAIELGMAKIQMDSNWRITPGSGDWFVDKPIGNGTMSLNCTIVSDGDVNPDNDSVVFTGTGVYGQSIQIIKVTLKTLSDKGGLVVSPGSWRRTGP